jgi:hypothetical protein
VKKRGFLEVLCWSFVRSAIALALIALLFQPTVVPTGPAHPCLMFCAGLEVGE